MTQTFEQWAESEGLDMSADWKGELTSPVTAGALRGWEAAQSAGKEAVYQTQRIMGGWDDVTQAEFARTHESRRRIVYTKSVSAPELVAHVRKLVNGEILDSTGCLTRWEDLPDGTPIYANAAPVNGGETEMRDAAMRTVQAMGYTYSGGDRWRPPMTERAADAQQVGAYGLREALEHIANDGMDAAMCASMARAALTSPAKVGVQPAHEQNARFAIDGAISLGMQGVKQPDADHWLAKYWDIGRQLAAKVGGDEREAFEAYLRGIWTQGYGCAKDEEGRYRDGNAQSLWECWRAALSADGGEDKRDAERYRWLRTNGDFMWVAPQERQFNIYLWSGGDTVDDAIDAAIAANQAKGE